MDPATYLEALKAERAGYIARGLPERAAMVDAEIARLTGTKPENTRAQAPERATNPRSNNR